MKILLINNHHYIRGGSESVYFNTGKLLESKGHQVIYFSVKNEQNEKYGSNKYFIDASNPLEGAFIKKVKRLSSFLYSQNAYKSLNILIKEEKPDIAHLHIFYGGLTSSILRVLKKHNLPSVMSVHEYRLLCPVYTCLDNSNKICEKCAKGTKLNCAINKCNKNNFFYSTISTLETWFRDTFFSHIKYINHFIMVSFFIRDKHAEYNKQYLTKSSVIYNFHKRSVSKISVDKNYDLVYFGRLSREKGVLTLIKAIEKEPSIKLKIIGTGPIEGIIREYINKNKVKNVELLGYLKGDDLWNKVQAAKFTVVPSEWYENNPMNVIESLFMGIPVIGANIGGIPEIVKESHGFIFEPNSTSDLKNKIINALSISNSEYLRLSENSKKFANNLFSEEIHYKQLIKVYEKLVKQDY